MIREFLVLKSVFILVFLFKFSSSFDESPPIIDSITTVNGNAGTGGGDVLLIRGKFFYNTTINTTVTSTFVNSSSMLNITNNTTSNITSVILSSVFPTVSIGRFECHVFETNATTNTTLNVTDSYIKCVIQKGEGKDLAVIVKSRGMSSNEKMFSYLPPKLIKYNSRSGSTLGGQLMIVNGTNFGLYPTVHFISQYTQYTQKAILNISFSELIYDHVLGYISFILPEGAGANLTISVCAGNQCAYSLETFSFHSPSLFNTITRRDRSMESCLPKITLMLSGRDTLLVNKTVLGNCFPTVGGYEILLTGINFGPSSLSIQVKLGSYFCNVVSHTHTSILCTVPAGYGESHPVTVVVQGQSSQINSSNPVFFSFDPPVIQSIYPNMPNGFGERLVISGYNFGISMSYTEILINNVECLNATWISDSTLSCIAPAGPVGSKSLSILTANRLSPFIWSEKEQLILYTCTKGSYGLTGETCINCETDEQGAVCPGGENTIDLVTAKQGYYRFNISNESDASIGCHPIRRSDRAECPVFVACEPRISCLGANKCLKGYSGARCAKCDFGYYRINGICRICPTQTWALLIFFLILISLLCFLLHILSSKYLSWPIGFICADWGQLMSLYSRLRIPWPANVSTVILGSSITTLNLDLIAPECTLPTVTLIGKWIAIEGLPFFIVFVLFFIFFLREAVWPCLLGKRCTPSLSDLSVRLNPYCATFIYTFRILFLYLCRNSLDIFNCKPTTPSTDGFLYLDGDLSIQCYTNGSPQMILLPYACVGAVIYILFFPILSFIIMYRNRDVILFDMIALARGFSLSSQTTKGLESDRNFRDRFHPLYHHFSPSAWYWEFIIATRKLAIISVSLIFNTNAAFQQGMVLLILLISSWLHLCVQPYFSHKRASRMLEVYDPDLHINVAAEISHLAEEDRSKESKETPSSNWNEMINTIKLRKAVLRVQTLAIVVDSHVFAVRKILQIFPFLSFTLDPNIIESSLLGSLSVLLILGLMLGSNEETLSPSVGSDITDRYFLASQRFQLGWAIFVINMFQLFYIALVILTDILIRIDSDKFLSFIFFFCSSFATTDAFEETVKQRQQQRYRREHSEIIEKQRFFVNNIVPKTFEQINEETIGVVSVARNVLRQQIESLNNGKRYKATPANVSGAPRMTNYSPETSTDEVQVTTISRNNDEYDSMNKDENENNSIISSQSAEAQSAEAVETAAQQEKKKSRWGN
jgi:hypothetical protein